MNFITVNKFRTNFATVLLVNCERINELIATESESQMCANIFRTDLHLSNLLTIY